MCVCGDGGREVIRLTHFHGEPGTGAIPTPYTVHFYDANPPTCGCCADPTTTPEKDEVMERPAAQTIKLAMASKTFGRLPPSFPA